MRGPRALALHPDGDLLYVLCRLSNSVAVVDTDAGEVVSEIALFDPSPREVREGRGFLFDARLSGNGTLSCAACHVDADRDGLAWDQGDPAGELFPIGGADPLHPMKGPLLTQTLRGLDGERLFHWRADRPGLASFAPTFETLLGGDRPSDEDLRTFVTYLRSIRFAPNPRRRLDDSLAAEPKGTSALDGERIFHRRDAAGRQGRNRFRCIDCHLEPSGSGGIGFTGSNGQPMKVAQLRGLHERDGRRRSAAGRTAGFGYGPDGSFDDLPSFLSSPHRFGDLEHGEKAALEAFLLAFPTDYAPAVGFALTVDGPGAPPELGTLVEQAERGRCDLIAKGVIGGRRVGLVYEPRSHAFLADRLDAPARSLAELLEALGQPGAVLTFLGVPPGSGRRLGIDRDADGTLDGDGA